MKKLILVFFASLVFFTTAGYAEDQSLEDLQTQMAEIKKAAERGEEDVSVSVENILKEFTLDKQSRSG